LLAQRSFPANAKVSWWMNKLASPARTPPMRKAICGPEAHQERHTGWFNWTAPALMKLAGVLVSRHGDWVECLTGSSEVASTHSWNPVCSSCFVLFHQRRQNTCVSTRVSYLLPNFVVHIRSYSELNAVLGLLHWRQVLFSANYRIFVLFFVLIDLYWQL